MLCSFSTLVDGNLKCDVSQEYPGEDKCIPFLKCEQDVWKCMALVKIRRWKVK